MAASLVSRSGTAQDDTSCIGEQTMGPYALPPQEKRMNATFADLESPRYVPRKLIRSVSSKLRWWRQRLDADADGIEGPSGNDQDGENGTSPGEEIFRGIVGRPVDALMDANAVENERWNLMGCFGLQGRVARHAYVERDHASEVTTAGTNENDAGGDAGRDQDAACREGGRSRPLGNHVGYLQQLELSRDKNRQPLQEINTSNSAQLGADRLNDERPSGRQQCGCFANGATERLKGRVNRSGRDEDTEARPLETNKNDAAGYYLGIHKDGGLWEVDCSEENFREALHEIGTTDVTQEIGADQLKDDKPSGRQQCGCFAKGGIEISRLKDWGNRKSVRESLQAEGDAKSGMDHCPRLPDDVVEMCLARTPFSTLASARLVCRKWRALTMSPHFLAIREKLSSRKPWLLLFGLSRDGVSGEIHALDPTFDRWHSIRADILAGKFLFSVASLNGLVYVIGGCSSSPSRHGRPDKNTTKTHKAVLVYNPSTGSWTKVCSMGAPRAMAVAGVFKLRDGRIVRDSSSRSFGSYRHEGSKGVVKGPSRSESGRGWCNLGTVGEISYEKNEDRRETWESAARAAGIDPVLSDPRSLGNITSEIDDGVRTLRETAHFWEESAKDTRSYGLIVVGGQGVWNEPLFSAEVYDPVTNTWREIAKLPPDHGVTCAGVVCNGLFYAYSETDKLAAYDFDLNIWTSIQVCNTLTRLHEYIPKLVSCKGRVFLLGVAWGGRETSGGGGGGNGMEKATRILWEFNPTLQAWLQISSHPDAPLDWNAVFVSEGDQIFGVEMFKIFGQVLDFVTVCELSGSQVTWERVSRMRIGNDLDVSSCITKTAIVVHL